MRPYTETTAVELPGGLALENGTLVTAVELRSLTGWEEEWLARQAGEPAAFAVSAIVNACTVAPGPMAGSLLAGDRDYLMLQLRRLTLGERVQTVIECGSCGAKMDVDFQVSDVPVERHPQSTPSHTLDLAGGRTVRFRLPNGADQESVARMPTAEAVETLLARCVLDGADLSPGERERVIAAMEARAPAVELELDLTCPECSHTATVPFDTTSFFIREMTRRRQHLLREVHSLALHYHWSEAEIMGMAQSRRREYLELLSESMHRE
jgi:hypothetical protein